MRLEKIIAKNGNTDMDTDMRALFSEDKENLNNLEPRVYNLDCVYIMEGVDDQTGEVRKACIMQLEGVMYVTISPTVISPMYAAICYINDNATGKKIGSVKISNGVSKRGRKFITASPEEVV